MAEDTPIVEEDPVSILQIVRMRKLCDSTCPVFESCLIMPLAVKPKVNKERTCLVNAEQPDIRMAYIHLALGGESELVDEIQRHFLGYLKEINDLELALKKKKSLTVKDRLLLLSLREKVMTRLSSIFRTKYGEKLTVKKDTPISQPIIIREITGPVDRRASRLITNNTPPTDEEKAATEALENAAIAKVTPDPESLVHSELVKEKILPSMIVVPGTEAPGTVPILHKPGTHPIIQKFFEVDDEKAKDSH